MVIEILFSEIANLYGDLGNVLYIEKSFPDVTIIKTSILDRPHFVDNDVDFIYLGSMSNNTKLLVINKLKEYKNRIVELINSDVVFLFTGNALEIMGSRIDNNDALDIFNINTTTNMKDRYNSLYLGEFDCIEEKIVGYKSQNTISKIDEDYLFRTIRENNKSSSEGIRVNNFFGTNLLGPILVLNPYFTKYLFSLLNYYDDIYLENELIDAYKNREIEYSSSIKY